MLGVCLLTLPTKTNANAADNTTILSENSTIQWKVVELDSSHDGNMAKIGVFADDEPYVKYVLRDNWKVTSDFNGNYGFWLPGQYIIFDLHGYTISYGGNYAISPIQAYCQVIEFTDSSTNHTGKIKAYSPTFAPFRGAKTTIVSGGNIDGIVNKSQIDKFIMVGGNCENTAAYPFFHFGVPEYLFLPNYVTTKYENNDQRSTYYRTGENTTSAGFAILGPTNNIVSGLHNYEFTEIAIENLGPGDCVLEKLWRPGLKHTLLYRSSPNEQYQVLITL